MTCGKRLRHDTHLNGYEAYEIARCVGADLHTGLPELMGRLLRQSSEFEINSGSRPLARKSITRLCVPGRTA